MIRAAQVHPILEGLSDRCVAAGNFVRSLSGWQRFSVALVAGLLSALAFAPFGIFPLLLMGFGVLVLLMDSARASRRPVLNSAIVGWAFGFGQFLAGFYWVGYAFLVDAMEHAWQIPLVEFFLPGGMALYIAAACTVASALWRPGLARIFVLASCYAIGEWLRGHLLTGFPWNLPAYGWSAVLPVLQSAALFGAYGLSLLTILFGASLAALSDRNRGRWLSAAMTLLFGVLWAGGEIRLAAVPTAFVPGVQLRLVQPDIKQQDKYLPEYRGRNWRTLIDLTTAPAATTPTHIIWPEAAPPFLLTRVPEALDQIAIITGQQRVLMTGAVRVLASPDNGFRFFNSFYIFGHGGQLLDAYDKFHLVPFGEYLPLASLLSKLGISKLVDSPGGFTAGDGPHAFTIPGAPAASPLICYEILFPGEVVGRTRPGWFVNVTDDSWFGPSTGPYQHLLTARVRAIEEGIPVARAANTGISAVIDPLGRVVASLGLDRQGVVNSPLPQVLPITPYARLSDVGFALMLVVCAGLACLWRSNEGEKGKQVAT